MCPGVRLASQDGKTERVTVFVDPERCALFRELANEQVGVDMIFIQACSPRPLVISHHGTVYMHNCICTSAGA